MAEIQFMRYILILFTLLLLTTSCSTYKKSQDYVFPTADGKAKYIQSYDTALKLWGKDVEEIDVPTHFGQAHVVMKGPKSGEPVILFHGMDASSTMWFPNVGEISKTYRVYAIDFPLEAGKSVAVGNKMSNTQILIFYNEIFDYLKLEHVNLIGASRGGWMAAYLALKPYNKVKKLVLLSPAQTFRGLKHPFKVFSAIKLKVMPTHKRLNKFFNNFSVYPDKIEQAYKDQFYLANVYAASKPRFINMQQFSKKELRTLKIPVLLLVGDHDIVNDAKTIENAKEVIPQIQAELLPNAGHFISIDQAETVNRKIIDFLNQK